MSEPDVPTGPADDELIAAVRSGDLGAFGTLFERHQDAARRLARQLTRGGADADDLVAGAFEKVMDQLRAGKGPDVAFRAYLLTAMRRLHVDQVRATQRVRPAEDADLDRGVDFEDSPLAAFEQGTAAAAFASLPERWQTVLWHLDVEGEKPAAVAPLLGMSANSVSALAYRAREGLRQAYLQQHLAPQVEDDHQWTLGNLGAFVRGGLAKRDTAKVREHLDRCARCTAVYLELDDVNARLGAILGPAVLGTAAAGYLGAAGGGAKVLALVGGWWSSGRSWVAGSTTNTVVAVAGAVTVAAVAGGLVYVVATGGDDEVSASLADRDSAGGRGGSGSPDADAPGAVPPGALPPGALPPGTTPPLVPRTPTATPPGVGAPGADAPGVVPQGGATGDDAGDDTGDDAGADDVGADDAGADGQGSDGQGLGDGDGTGDGNGEGDGDGDGPEEVPLGTPDDVTAAITATGDGVLVRWTAAAGAEGYDVFRDDSVAGRGAALVRAAVPARVNPARLPVSARSFVDDPPAAGTYTYTVRAVRDGRHGPAGSSAAARVAWSSQLEGRGQLRARSVLPQETAPRCLVADGSGVAFVPCSDDLPGVVLRGSTIRVDSRCLARDAAAVRLETCRTGAVAQQWLTEDAAHGGSRIVAADNPSLVLRVGGDGQLVLGARTSDARRPALTRPERFDLPGVDGQNPGVPDDPDPSLVPPSGVRASVTGRTVELQWDEAEDVDGYVVYRDGRPIDTVTGTTSTDTGVPPGRHAYTVRSLRDDTESAPSDAVEAALKPASPTDLAATVDGRSVTLTWSLPSGVEGVVVRRDGEPVARLSTPATAFSETVVPGIHAYTVSAVQGAVESEPSPALSVTVARPQFTAPRIEEPVEEGGGVRLAWSEVEDVDGYRVTRDGTVVARSVQGTTYLDATVLDGPHTWTVRAVRDDGTAGPVAEATLDVGLEATAPLRFADTYAGGTRFCVHPDAGVVLRSCAGAPDWRFYDDGTIRATADDRCLRADSQDVSLSTTCTGPAALWRPGAASDFGGRFLANGRATGLVLDAEGGLMRPEDALIVYPRKADGAARTGNDNQRFELPVAWAPGTPPPALAR